MLMEVSVHVLLSPPVSCVGLASTDVIQHWTVLAEILRSVNPRRTHRRRKMVWVAYLSVCLSSIHLPIYLYIYHLSGERRQGQRGEKENDAFCCKPICVSFLLLLSSIPSHECTTIFLLVTWHFPKFSYCKKNCWCFASLSREPSFHFAWVKTFNCYC